MPYEIVRRRGKYQVVNSESGHVKGTHGTEKEAQKQINLLRGVEHGWTPTQKKGK